MSIYSGFPTRTLESAYNQCICDIILIMQKFIVELLKVQKSFTFQAFSEDFSKTLYRITKLEQKKHLQPSFSLYMQDLDSYFKNIGVKVLPKSKERESPLNTSYGIFDKRSDIFRKTLVKIENPGSSKVKQRDEIFSNRESPRFFHKDKKIRVYQDKILKSIIKDLAFDC